MTLDEKQVSAAKADLEKGSTSVAGEYRKVKQGARKTAIGKAIAHQSEKQRVLGD